MTISLSVWVKLVVNKIYPSDLTDSQWNHIEDFFPLPKRTGRPRQVEFRQIVNGVLYLVITGCQWRFLPTDYGKWQTVYHYFARWQKDGLWHRIHETLRSDLRKKKRRHIPRLIQTIFGLYGPLGGPPVAINIPPAPRNDLVQIFATGIPAGAVPGLPNYTTVIQGTTGPHEYMRLNLAIAITPVGSQNRLGLLGNDAAGFPNGRRPIDDVVDIELRAAVGGTPFTPMTNVAPNNTLGDGVSQNDVPFLTRFPYLASPNAGNQPKASNFPAP